MFITMVQCNELDQFYHLLSYIIVINLKNWVTHLITSQSMIYSNLVSAVIFFCVFIFEPHRDCITWCRTKTPKTIDLHDLVFFFFHLTM